MRVKGAVTPIGIAEPGCAYIPGSPPLPFIASIWRIIFRAPPPLNIFIIYKLLPRDLDVVVRSAHNSC